MDYKTHNQTFKTIQSDLFPHQTNALAMQYDVTKIL